MTIDPQRESVYEWEGEFLDWNRQTLTLPSARQYVRTACAYYGLEAPAVKRHRTGALAFYLDDGSLISFPDWCMNPAVALHESAHHVISQTFGNRVQDHGREWLGVYMWLLEKSGVAPSVALRASARARGLRWRLLSPDDVPARAAIEIRTARALLHAGRSGRRAPRRSGGST